MKSVGQGHTLYLCEQIFKIFIINVETRKSLRQVSIIMYNISRNAPAHNSRPCSHPVDEMLYSGDLYLWVFSSELASCHSSEP